MQSNTELGPGLRAYNAAQTGDSLRLRDKLTGPSLMLRIAAAVQDMLSKLGEHG